MTTDTPAPMITANLADPVLAPASRLEGHLAVLLSMLATAAGLMVFLSRALGFSDELAGVTTSGFVALAMLVHVAVAAGSRPAARADKPRRRRSNVAGATPVATGVAGRADEHQLEDRQPARSPFDRLPSEPRLGIRPEPPQAAADMDWQTQLALQFPDQDEIDERRPTPVPTPPGAIVPEPMAPRAARYFDAIPEAPAAHSAPRRPDFELPLRSTIDENEVQRVERLVKQLADNVRQLEATAAAGPSAPPPLPRATPPGPTPVMEIAAAIASVRRAENEARPLPMPPLATSARDTQRTEGDNERAEILGALNAQRIDVFLEPILDIREQRPQHYQVSIGLRTANGRTVDLVHAEQSLGGTGLLPLLDQTRIVQAVSLAERLAERGKSGSVVTDVHGETLTDAGFKTNFAERNSTVGAFPGHLVLALPQRDVAHFATADWQTLARLRAAGFGFALTGISSLDMDFEVLTDRGFVIARLDADTFLHGLPAEGGIVPPSDICRHLASCGLALVVGGIVDDQQLARIFGFGVLFGQGQVFGGPRAVAPTAASAISAGVQAGHASV